MEGIELLKSAAEGTSALPAFVLCDVRMPGADGFEMLTWFRSQKRFNDVYFAMHTGGDVPADRDRAMSLGANDFLTKFPTVAQMRHIAAKVEAVRAASGLGGAQGEN